MTWTLISLTTLGVLTVFWEPLAALAGSGPTGESVGETHANSGAGGGGSTASPSVTSPPAGPMDGSASS